MRCSKNCSIWLKPCQSRTCLRSHRCKRWKADQHEKELQRTNFHKWIIRVMFVKGMRMKCHYATDRLLPINNSSIHQIILVKKVIIDKIQSLVRLDSAKSLINTSHRQQTSRLILCPKITMLQYSQETDMIEEKKMKLRMSVKSHVKPWWVKLRKLGNKMKRYSGGPKLN